MKILLITNNTRIIDMYENKTDIINSIFLSFEIEKEYDYIIIDEENYYLEKKSLQKLQNIKHKIAILGYSQIEDYMLINKDEFSLEDIEHCFDEDIVYKGEFAKKLVKGKDIRKLTLKSKKTTFIKTNLFKKYKFIKLKINQNRK